MIDDTIIVVPCYNEAGRLDLPSFDEFLYGTGGISFLLVDDGSRDGTPQVLEQLRSRHPHRVAVLGLRANMGKAEAVRRGMKLALRRSPAFVGYWDADLATPLETIVQFQEVLAQRPELVLVMGSRVALLGRQIRRSWRRHLMGRAFASAASLALGLTVYDTQCGAKLFRVTPATAALFDQPFRARWIFDVEILARLIALEHATAGNPPEQIVCEHPLQRWEDVDGSRLRPGDFLMAALDLAAIRWRYGRRRATQPTERPNRESQPARVEVA